MADLALEAGISEDPRPKWRRRPRKRLPGLDMKAAKEKRGDTDRRSRKDSGCCMDDGASSAGSISEHSTAGGNGG